MLMDITEPKRKPAKQAKTYRLSSIALSLLDRIAALEGKTCTAVLEEAIRETAKKRLKNT